MFGTDACVAKPDESVSKTVSGVSNTNACVANTDESVPKTVLGVSYTDVCVASRNLAWQSTHSHRAWRSSIPL